MTDFIEITPSPHEKKLALLVWIISGFVWLLLLVSIAGLFYAVLFALFLFMMHATMIAHVRGSAVQLGPKQFPEIHDRFIQLCHQFDLDDIPEAYIMQAGGVLNAFATKLLRSNMVILHSELIDACGNNTAARDMIIAHELGHIRSGHLKWHWFKAPGMVIPFLGTAYSRAREYTCDKFGLAGSGNTKDALRGLAILAAGAKQGPLINLEEYAKQKSLLNTGLMTLGEWMSTHPPLTKRMIAIDDSLLATPISQTRGQIRATAAIVMVAMFIALIPITFAILQKYNH